MTEPSKETEPLVMPQVGGEETALVKRIFKWLEIALGIGAALFCCYWLFSTDRYVSKASIIIQNTDQVAAGVDTPVLMSSMASISSRDQLLLQAHLLSVDMLRKLDKQLDLRAHFSDSSRDIASRMWFQDASIEWFHRHYLNRVEVFVNSADGVLQIQCQAYSAQMAHDITAMLVSEGEKYMNEMSHKIARNQVAFLESQVEKAQHEMRKANDELIAFQNKKGLLSAKAQAENIHKLIGQLEQKRTQLETQLATLPKALDKSHPTRRSINQSLKAVEKQISDEQTRLASTEGSALNTLVEEEQRLELEVKFQQDVYKSALVALEQGRMNAARTLKSVSVIQSPTLPEYAWEPRRIYGTISTLCVAVLIFAMLRMLRSIILDHVD